MKYKAVVADVDGTLMAPSEFPALRPSEKLVKTVKKINKKGVVFSLASGRSLAWVGNIIKGLDLKSPIILDNGAHIYDCRKKKYIWESLLPKKKAKEILSFLQKDNSLRLFILDDNQRLDDPAKIIKWKISKILVLGLTPKKAEVLYQKLRIFPEVHVTKTVSGANPPRESIHITNYNATKQVAVLKLAESLGISTKEIIGIGDSYNDFPLLMACGLKVAMANATPDIKAIADYIAPSYEEDGVVEVLERFVLNC